MELENIVFSLQQDVKELFGRMGKVEDKASGAWKTINETHERMKRIEHRMDRVEEKLDSLEVDVKDLKSTQRSITKTLKTLSFLVGVMVVISIGVFVYIWRHDAELAKSIITLGTLVTKGIA